MSCYRLDTECPSHPVLIFQISTLLPFFNQKFLNKRVKLNDTPDIEALIAMTINRKNKPADILQMTSEENYLALYRFFSLIKLKSGQMLTNGLMANILLLDV